MSFFSAGEMAGFRDLQDSARPDTCELLTKNRTETDEGSGTTAEVIVDVVPCRLRTPGSGRESAQERQIIERLAWSVAYSIDFPPEVVLTPDQRVRVNGDREFEVGGVIVTENWGVWATAVCQEVTP